MATHNTNVSSKYEDIISRSVLLHPGPPAVYQLRPKEETFGTLTRKTVGERNVNQINKTILVVGETGTGKSSLINALVNYAMGVKWEDEVWLQIVDEKKEKEEETRSQTESQTSDVIVYQVFGFEGEALPYSLTIIDTPGFGDTRGIEQDDVVSKRLLDLFGSEDGVNEVNAVGLVLKASENRLSDRLMYVLNSVMSLFGKNLEKNIVALITHSEGRNPKNPLQALEAAKVKCARNEKDQPVYFLFNNCQQDDRTEDAEFLEGTFRLSERGMSQFTAFLDRTGPLKMMTTVEVLNERVRLAACIQNLQERIKFTENKQRDIQEVLKEHEAGISIEWFYEVYKEKEPVRGGMVNEAAVCCTVCEENCHYPGCTMAWTPEDCEVMKGGRCTSCTNRCPASAHVKEKWRYVTKTRRVEKTLEDMKLKYEENQLRADKTQWLEEAYQHVVRLKEIALEAGSVSTYVHLDFLIEKMKEKGDTEKVQELEEMKRRMEEGTRAAVQHKFSNVSSKYEDIISRSVLLHPGSPDVYQLRTKKENIGTLTKLAVGERNVNKINKTILVVGETGAGKSALINALVNYAMGVKWEDEVWFQIVDEKKEKEEEEERRSQSESQTPDVIVYQVFGFEGEALPYSLTIIDTPGFGDTRGPEKDVIISQRLLDLFRSEDGLNEVNAVGLVLKASDNRLSDRQIYVFNSVMSLFGKNLEKYIVALITHSDGLPPENPLQALEAAKVKCARNETNQPVCFLFSNQQKKQRGTEEKTKDALKRSWDTTKEGMSEFTAFLEKTGPQKLVTTVEVLNERVRLAACIQNLQDRIEFIEAKQTEISQTEEALKEREEEMKKNQEFTVEVDEPYKYKEPIGGRMRWLVFFLRATCCTVCEENCHALCTMVWKPEDCEVMKDGRCTSCTNKCPASDHVKEKWRYVTKTRRVKKTLIDMKLKYEENQRENQKKSSLLEDLKKEMDQLTADKTRWLEEAYQHVVKLKEIALEADSVSTHVHLDYLIEKMKEKGDTEKVQELEEMKKQQKDKKLWAAVGYMWGKMKTARKAVKDLM